jgi:hypothetical protein
MRPYGKSNLQPCYKQRSYTTDAIGSTTWRCASAYRTSDDSVAAVVRMLRGRRFPERFDVAERSAGKGPNAPANALPVRPGSSSLPSCHGAGCDDLQSNAMENGVER